MPSLRYRPAPGPDDFKVLRENGHFYVDKTAFVAEVLTHPDQVLLIPRPRRFGKSLNLSTLRYYVERGPEDRSALFEGLAITRERDEVQAHQGRHPVVFLGLKGARAGSWELCLGAITAAISDAALAHPELEASPALTASQRQTWAQLVGRSATQGALASSLRDLTAWLHAHYGVPAMVLIDEYDAPIEAGYANGYYPAVVSFVRNLLGEALKTNPHLVRGVLTGVRRIAKESLFSGLNNVRVCSVLDPDFSSGFGFTEPEVAQVLAVAGRVQALDEIRGWYNGYNFGGQTIYNPWSVLSYARDGVIKEYWVQTSSEELLYQLIPNNRAGLRGPFERLLQGGSIEEEIDEQVVLRDLVGAPRAIWSFLLTAGYLTFTEVAWREGRPFARLVIPNREVMGVWRRQFHHWLELGLGGGVDVEDLLGAVLAGDARVVQRLLRVLVRNVLSYHDTASGPDADPERVYQAFVLGLLAWLEPRYRVRSNRESGHGRADVLLLPTAPGNPGVVLEIKRVWTDEGETPDRVLDEALQQIADRGYRAEVEAAGADPVVVLAVAFAGKEVWVRRG